jgi:hypothetical protein
MQGRSWGRGGASNAAALGGKMGAKTNILTGKNDFLRLTNFKLLNQIKENSTNDFDFFQVHNSF